MEKYLYEKLAELNQSDEYPFHMPGHKRNVIQKKALKHNISGNPVREVVQMDITEIEGFDNLHHSEGIIQQEQEFAAKLYGARQTFYLVNGSTCGVLSAICGSLAEGEKIVLARNSHKSAYNAVYLKKLEAHYVYPVYHSEKPDFCGPVRATDIARQMDETGAKVCFVTSPTYEGILSDIEKIADMVHEREGILIVDEAHGAHLGFHSYFPESAISRGADIVIQSLHKTLPSLTQTALLHICSDRPKVQEIRKYLGIFQSSSPSYVLMASMSDCLHFLAEEKETLFSDYAGRLEIFFEKAKSLKAISVLNRDNVSELFHAQMDPSKLNICVENVFDGKGIKYKGRDLAKDLIEKYHLQPEMVSENYVLAMTSIFDTEEGFQRLLKALVEIDAKLYQGNTDSGTCRDDSVNVADTAGEKSIRHKSREKEIRKPDKIDKIEETTRLVPWEEAVGEISEEYIYLYPPGSPIIVPGEEITPERWKKIDSYKKMGLNIQGPLDYELNNILVAGNK